MSRDVICRDHWLNQMHCVQMSVSDLSKTLLESCLAGCQCRNACNKQYTKDSEEIVSLSFSITRTHIKKQTDTHSRDCLLFSLRPCPFTTLPSPSFVSQYLSRKRSLLYPTHLFNSLSVYFLD